LRTRPDAEAGRGRAPVPARDRAAALSLGAEVNRGRAPEALVLSRGRALSLAQSHRSVTTKITANRAPEAGVSRQTVGALAVVLSVETGLSRSPARDPVPDRSLPTKTIARPTGQSMATTDGRPISDHFLDITSIEFQFKLHYFASNLFPKNVSFFRLLFF